jgi:hypothetical protein
VDKDKLTITIHRYSLKSKKTRGAIMEKLMANLESKKSKKGNGRDIRGEQKAEVGD